MLFRSAWGRISVNQIAGVIGTAGFSVGGVNKQVRGSVLAMNRFGESLAVQDIGNDLEGDGGNALIAGVVGTWGGTFGQIRAYRTRRDSPFAPYDGDPAVDRPYIQLNSQLLFEGGHTREINKRLVIAGRAYLNLYRFFDDIKEIATPDPPNRFLDYGDSTTVGGELRARYEAIEDGKLGITTGAEASYNKTKSRSFYDGDEANGAGGTGGVPLDFNIEGIYTELDTQPTKWFGATGGVRFDRNSKVDRRLSPRAALFFAKPEKYGVKLLYAEGFRNPSAFEGFFEDGVDFSANPAITSERIRSLEAVLWAKPLLGLATRLSGFYWDARDVVVQVLDPMDLLLQFQNIGRFVTQGVEAELTYRNSAGWYGFGGATLAKVGEGDDVAYGRVIGSPKLTAAGGISTPKLAGYAHLSVEGQLIGRRLTRDAADGSASPAAPAWLGLNAAVYVPDLHKVDLTAGVRNILGTRDLLPAPGDYDRFGDPSMPIVVPRIPGEGREVYVKIGYSY